MDPLNHRLKLHIFICTNERPEGAPRGSCARRGSEQLVQLFKQEVLKLGLTAEVRAQKAGCLDLCEKGPTVVIYPDAVWYGPVSDADVPGIVRKHALKAVERPSTPGID